ncbi:hypothetical protein K1T71_010648 [Dendrolimus kikuchii]|uniref:Uncharacterized protein n=1 Tax=Dendrolimus kikuchii TaxID=765133 RepID=A0ACC1CQ15_9NEOP|nr:hypothetical protein K1T71_010648 [Dendrolimus kikuchii]
MIFKIFSIILICSIQYCISKRYENYTLFRAIPVEENHLQFFQNSTELYAVNFWRPPGTLFKPVEFTISPDWKLAFLKDAERNNIYLTTIIEDVQQAFDQQTVKTYIRRRMDSFDWRNYFGLKDIYNWLKDLQRAYPRRMMLKSIGKTYEHRDIYAAVISFSELNTKPKVFIEGGIHAREWISPAFVTYFLYQLLTARESSDLTLIKLAMRYEWHFVPILNPDGYEYTHTHDRMWRKNRHNGDEGVDINRNFAYGFGQVGVSKRKSSEIYCGERAFSERESLALADYVRANSKNIEYYLAFHSYGQYMIIPYAHSKHHEENFDTVREMGLTAANAINTRFKTKYTVGTAYDTVGYMTSGVSGCWVKKTFAVPAFDAELYSRKKRDTNRQQLYWTNYQMLDDIYRWFEYLAQTYSGVVTLIDAGESYEGRKILGVKISRGSGRRSFVLQGSQIGADWLSPTVITYIVDQLVRGEDPDARAASEDFDWHVFPVINPDGFNFTQESVRLWIKNRRPITQTAIGVDLSRNWNSQWGIIGASFNPADNNYVGLGPFSEIETRLISSYVETVPNLTGFLSFRSFGQRLIIPFAHSTDHVYNYRDMVAIGRRAMGSLAVKYGTQYLVGTSREVLDGATGNIADWVKHRFNPPIVATYMLRDNGAWGYTLPVNQILPSCEETFDSVMAILREAKAMNVL